MKKTFKIVKCTAGKTNNFVSKLVREAEKDTVFGNKRGKETYYISGSKQMLATDAAGAQVPIPVELEMDEWRIEEYAFSAVDTATGGVTAMKLKWLHVRI